MFMIYGLAAGVLLGLLLGGRLSSLAAIRLRGSSIALAGLLVQAVLFAAPVARSIEPAVGIAIYVVSTGLVILAIGLNVDRPPMRLVMGGALCNFVAVMANGGLMPTAPHLLAQAGRSAVSGFSNSSTPAEPVLPVLTDIFAMPSWMPFANVFSVGDVLVLVGTAWLVVAAMRARPANGGPSSDMPAFAA